jgi:hypothetical protein
MEALWALTNITSSADCKDVEVVIKYPGALVAILGCATSENDTETVTQAVWTMANIAGDGEEGRADGKEGRAALLNVGALKVFLSLLGDLERKRYISSSYVLFLSLYIHLHPTPSRHFALFDVVCGGWVGTHLTHQA